MLYEDYTISILKIDLLEEEERIEEAVELEWAEMQVNLDLHILTLMSNSKRQEKGSYQLYQNQKTSYLKKTKNKIVRKERDKCSKHSETWIYQTKIKIFIYYLLAVLPVRIS